MYIYLIVNHVTGKYYVGQHKGNNLRHYLQQKFYDAWKYPEKRSHLYASMRKHGRSAFTIHALLSDIQTKAELDQKEKEFIDFLHSRDPEYGYNICKGGEGFTGKKSAESRERNRQNSLLTWKDPDIRKRRVENQAKIREQRGGTFLTTDSVVKIKQARAAQDEASRLEAFNQWKTTVPADHFSKIGSAASREDKARAGRMGSTEDKQRAARISVQGGSLIKAQHVRWHVNRGQSNPNCSFCEMPGISGTI